MAQVFYQDPNAKLDYNVDWTSWLNGDTINTSAWQTHPDLTTSGTSNTTTVTTVYITGGTAGRTYKVRNRITTVTKGLTEDETFDLVIRDH